MKYVPSVLFLCTALMIVGCADSSSINAPVSPSQEVFSKPNFASTTSGSFKVEQQVVASGSGEEFIVVGRIYYDYTSKDGGSGFGYKARTDLVVIRASNPDQQYPANEILSQDGTTASGASPQMIAMSNLSNVNLVVQFSVDNGFELSDIQLNESSDAF